MYEKKLIKAAIKAKKYSYSPYSKFKVGAALITNRGKIYTGSNIENASYSATVCAERVAIFKAVSEGDRNIRALAIAGDSEYTYPCGICRQVIREFGKDIDIIVVNSEKDYKKYKLDDLLPFSFGPQDLNKSQE